MLKPEENKIFRVDANKEIVGKTARMVKDIMDRLKCTEQEALEYIKSLRGTARS